MNDNEEVRAIIGDVMSRLREILEVLDQVEGKSNALSGYDVATISHILVMDFPEEKRLTAAMTLLTIIRGLIEQDIPRRALDQASINKIQADMLLASVFGEA